MKTLATALSAILWMAGATFAHDPGLSSAEFILNGNTLTGNATFALKDIDELLQLDSSQDGRLQDAEIEEASDFLAEFGEMLYSIRLHDTEVQPTAALVSADLETGDLTFELNFEANEVILADSLSIEFIAFDDFAVGHRQYLKVLDQSGEVIDEQLLSRPEYTALSTAEPAAFTSPMTSPESPRVKESTLGASFFILGMEHLLIGYDHILFLLALLLVARTLWHVISLITTFTIAHSLTLGMATLLRWQAPASIVEPLIALSIVVVGVLHLWMPAISIKWLVSVTFGFGLVHGLGFAGVLQGLGISSDALFRSLLGFNLGVEAGQILVALVLFPVIRWMRQIQWRQVKFQPAAHAMIAVTGLYWLMERI